MSPQSSQRPLPTEEALLTPREVAELFGVRTTTIARWAREGKLTPSFTPGGHRRYRRADVHEVLTSENPDEDQAMAKDAVRLYEQGWSIRQVADRFGYNYGAMRRLLKRHTRLRTRTGLRP